MGAISRGLVELRVSSYTVVLDPDSSMLGPLSDGGLLFAHTAQGCWGPMVTPEMQGSHEVTQPVAVDGAEVGDALAVSIKRLSILSKAATSGVHSIVPDRHVGDPSIAACCPRCGRLNPPSEIVGTGPGAVRCRACGEEISPYLVAHGYTMLLDRQGMVGVTVGSDEAERIGSNHREFSGLAEGAKQNSALALAPSDMPGVLCRLRPMIGNIGTVPGVRIPAANNAGDAGQRLVGASHALSITREQLGLRTDGHMDIDSVGEGTVVVCPVRVPGGGLYIGDAHAMQGDGEVAGHTTDVAAEVVVQVSVIKGLAIDGPMLLPRIEDVPPLARPFSPRELLLGAALAQAAAVRMEGPVAPVQVVGSGANLMEAVECGLERLAGIGGISVDEARNRVTVSGGIEIGRLPGVVHVTALLPLARLDSLGLGSLYRAHYGIEG